MIQRVLTGLACALVAFNAFAAKAPPPPKVDPFASNDGSVPTPAEYNGPLFKLSHNYPLSAPVPAMPWQNAIGNSVITTQNAPSYAQALKDAVGKDMRVLLSDYDNWNAAARGWYNEPWLGAEREAIHGMYVGSDVLAPSLFKASGLRKPITTYVLTYYDRTAAQTLNNVWGRTAAMPQLRGGAPQFKEGALIVKAAFVTADPEVWPVMTGSQVWPLYITKNATTGQFDRHTVSNTYLMQLDIIVKDSQSAPLTGWVFSTLVYDKNIKPGAQGVWDQMVPLGAQWGNDPQANSSTNPSAPLRENWNNPAAPAYGAETLGWGERLSGPNDGAMNDISYVAGGRRQYVGNARNSSCMSCHSTAQWDASVPSKGMVSFLLPLIPPSPPADAAGGQPYLNSPAPGSADWLRWFQNRLGHQPMDPGSVATDFDMVLAFKSLPVWYQATYPKDTGANMAGRSRSGKRVFMNYNGKEGHR